MLAVSIAVALAQAIMPRPAILAPGPLQPRKEGEVRVAEVEPARTLLTMRVAGREVPDWYNNGELNEYLKDKHCAWTRGIAVQGAEVHLLNGGRVVSRIAPSSAPELLAWLKQFLGD